MRETLTSAAEAAPTQASIAGLKPCAAQVPKRPDTSSNCRSLSLVGMTNLTLIVRMLGRQIGQSWRDCGAAEIAEAAFVLPLLFMFIFGIFQFGRMYLVYSTLQRAAMEGARSAAGSKCATCGVGPLTAAQVATTVIGPILQNAHVDATLLTAPATAARNSCTGAAVACDATGT